MPVLDLKDVMVIKAYDKFCELCEELAKSDVIALDVETSMYDNPPKLSLIQIATHDQIWVVDHLAIRDVEPLRDILEDDCIIKIIHNAAFEKKVFSQFGVEINNVFDTLKASRTVHGYRTPGGHSLKVVCQRELCIELDKEMQSSNWMLRPLTSYQMRYAAMDVDVLIKLYDIFKGQV